MDELERSAQLLKEALDELRRQGVLTAQTMDRLNRATAANTGAQQNQAKTVEETDKQFKKLYDTTKQVVGGFLDTAQQARRNREDFTSLNPAIRATGTMFGKTSKTVGAAAESMGDALIGAGIFAKHALAKGILIGLGGIFKGGGALAKALGEEAGKAIAEYGTFVAAEIQRVVDSFKTIASVGALGADGMRGFIDAANQSGLAYEQFSRVFAKNSQNLSQFAGTALAGRNALAAVSEAAKPFEEQFLAMGIGFEEQRDMYAKSMHQSRILGNIARGDAQAQAEAARDYVYQLKELTALTGLQNDQAEALLEKQRADIRFQAVMAQFGNAVDLGGKNMAQGFQRIGSILTTEVGPTIGVGFQDAISNLGTDAAKSFMLATGGAGKQIIEDYRANRITQEQALFQIDEAIRKRYATLGGARTQAALGKLGTAFENTFPEMFRLTTRQGNLADSLGQAQKAVEGSAAATNDETKEIIKAQKNLQNFAQQLDMLVSKKILPNAASHIQLFTKALSGSIDYINEKLGVKTKPTVGEAGAPAAGGLQGPPGGRAPGTGPSGLMGAAAKNLNPGNLRFAGQKGATVGTGGFAAFQTVDEGLVALANQLNLYMTGKSAMGKRDTIESIISAYAPPNENKTQQYIDQMARFMGKNPSDVLPRDPATLAKLMVGIIGKESMGGLEKGYNMRSGIQFAVAQVLGVDPSKIGHFQNGGVTSGPRTGYTAMLHGTEAIVPLPDGRSIPVEMNGMTDKIGEQLTMMGQQITSLNELVSLMRANNDISTRILRSSAA